MEFLRVIAMLCSLSTAVQTAPTVKMLMKEQMECHKYYADCFDKKHKGTGFPPEITLECIRDRK